MGDEESDLKESMLRIPKTPENFYLLRVMSVLLTKVNTLEKEIKELKGVPHAKRRW